jgi:hypothetical protein
MSMTSLPPRLRNKIMLLVMGNINRKGMALRCTFEKPHENIAFRKHKKSG